MRYYVMVNDKTLIFWKDENLAKDYTRTTFNILKDKDTIKIVANGEVVWGPYTVGKHKANDLK